MKGNEPVVHGGVLPSGLSVGGVLLEVDSHVMGCPGRNHPESMELLRSNLKFGKWRCLIKEGASFVGGRHVSQDTNWRFRANIVEDSESNPRSGTPQGHVLSRNDLGVT